MPTQLIPWQALDDFANEFLPGYGEARAYRNLMCEIRAEYPWAFTAGVLGSSISNPITALQLANGSWDRICRAIPPPATSQENEPFIGGQCPVIYLVQCTIRSSTGSVVAGSEFVLGPLQQLYIKRTVVNTSPRQIRFDGIVMDAAGVIKTVASTVVTDPATATGTFTLSRQDGQPDDCGDRPIFIDIPPAPINPTSIRQINLGDQIQDVEVTITGLDQTNFPDIQFSPEFEIGGIPVRATTAGIEIEWPDQFPLSQSVEPYQQINLQLQPIIQNTQNIQTGIDTVTLNLSELTNLVDTRTQTILDKLEQCCEEEYELVTEVLSADTGGDLFALPSDTIAVRAELLGTPTSKTGKMIGPGDSLDVYFWGWGSPGFVGGAAGPRQPLHHRDQTFEVPPDSVTFNLAPTYLNRARVTAIRKVLIA